MKLRIQLFALLGVVLAVTATCSKSDKPSKLNLEPAKPDDTSVSAEAPAFGPIVVTGELLPTRSDEGTDKAIGRAAPVVEGRAPDNATVLIGGPGKPTVVAFVAHWCPHCQKEVPVIVSAAKAGAFGDVRLVAVATGTNKQAPNYPPVAWLERESWTGEVILDDKDASAARAYGLSGYPFLVAINANGKVVGRTSGELPREDLVKFAKLAAG